MTAKDYGITLGFNSTDWPYSPGRPHEGIDRGSPTGTPLVVSGTEIARTGATGNVTGPHTHYAKFLDGRHQGGVYSSALNRTYFDPSDAFYITGVVSFAQDNGSAGKEVIIDATNGYRYRYLHNNEIKVNVGQRIGADMAVKTTLGTARILAETILGRDRDAIHQGKQDADLNAHHVGKDLTNQYIQDLWVSDEAVAAANLRRKYATFYNDNQGKIEALTKENNELKAQLALQSDDTKNLNAFGESLKWFITRLGVKK